jgi:hypothetical protein
MPTMLHLPIHLCPESKGSLTGLPGHVSSIHIGGAGKFWFSPPFYKNEPRISHRGFFRGVLIFTNFYKKNQQNSATKIKPDFNPFSSIKPAK